MIHTHSPYATGFAIVGEPDTELILVEMLPFLGGDIPVAAFGLPGTDEVGIHAAQAMKARNAALLENHGVAAVGKTVEQAYLRAVYVEDAAKAYHFAKLMGTPQRVPDDAVRILRKRYHLPEEGRDRGVNLRRHQSVYSDTGQGKFTGTSAKREGKESAGYYRQKSAEPWNQRKS